MTLRVLYALVPFLSNLVAFAIAAALMVAAAVASVCLVTAGPDDH